MNEKLSILVLGSAFVAPSVCLAGDPPASTPTPVVTPSTPAEFAPVHVNLWGLGVCLGGQPPGVSCDFTFAPEPRDQALAKTWQDPVPRRWSLLGRDVCVGGEQDGCWLSLPTSPPTAGSPSQDAGRGS